MGFIESTAAGPAQSTALLAGSLPFWKISALAWFGAWTSFNAFNRPDIIKRAIATLMILLGGGVVAVALGRYMHGSHPLPIAIAIIGGFSLLIAVMSSIIQRRLAADGGETKSISL